MIKKITMLIFLILLSAAVSLGQMASLGNTTAYPNTNTSVAVNVDGFNTINSLTFFIQFDPDVLDFIGISNQALPGMMADVTGSQIAITWSSPVIAYSPAGLLCNLNFLFKGTSSPVVFLPGCEVTQGALPFTVGYLNGSVSPAPCVAGDSHAGIADGSVATGGVLSLPVNLSDFPLVGSFTQVIEYDESMLNFISITTGGNLTGCTYNNANGIITIAWTSTAGKNINTVPASANQLLLNFECNIPGNTTISYAPGSVFNEAYPSLANVQVCYSGGNITQSPTAETAILESLTGVIQGEEVSIPLNLNISVPVSAFTLFFDYNTPVLGFTGIEVVNPLSSDVIANASGGQLTLAFTNMSPAVIPAGTFLKLKFHYNGIGAGFVDFAGQSQFVDNLFQAINVALTNATVAPGVFPPNATATIGNVDAQAGMIVDVPLNLDGATANPLGAATMYIGYDNSKLSFVGAVDNVFNANINFTNDQISIAWADPAGVNLNGLFLKLRFQYHGGGGLDCGSELFFQNDYNTFQACELASVAAAFVPANWVNGGVNLDPALPVVNGPANPLVNSTVAYSTDAGMINYNWTVSGGAIVSGQGTASVNILWGAAGSGSIDVFYHTPGSCYLQGQKNVMILSGSPVTDIQGYVTYDNASSQGMNGVNITLYNSVGVQVGSPVSTITNVTNGYFNFPGVPQDAYTLAVSLAAPWAGVPGVSATDALIVELHTAGILNPALSGIRFQAGNVTGGPTVNATDALFIKKRIIGDISSFPIGDWVFNNGTINAFASPVTNYDFKGLCSGDVNGSYSPVVGVKETPSCNLAYSGEIRVIQDQPFSFDILSDANLNLGAITLVMTFDPSNYSILEVSSPLEGIVYSVRDGLVTIAWSDATSAMVASGNVLVSFRMIARTAVTSPADVFSVVMGTEFAGPMADVLGDVRLKASRIVSVNSAISLEAYPNPFREYTTISVSIPKDGRVEYVVYDMLGNPLLTVANGFLSAGTHTFRIDAGKISQGSGVFLGKLRYDSEIESFSSINKLVITK